MLRAWLEAATELARAPLPPAVHEAIRVAVAESLATKRVDLAVDRVILAIDRAIHAVLDDVLHHADFQRLEAAWRGLEYVVESAALHANVKIAVWNWTKEDLARDFDDASDPTRTRTYAEAYTAEYGVFGGEPYAAILASMEFGPDPGDVRLLRSVAGIAAMAHAPFFASPSPRLLQLESWRDLQTVTEVEGVFEAPRFTAWNALRDEPDARYLGLILPRYLARRPYASLEGDGPFGYTEQIASDGTGLLWGSPVFPFAARLAATFARYGTLSALAADDADAPEVPVRVTFPSLGTRYVRPPVEVVVTARVERMLREVGLIALMTRKGTARVWMASANTLQSPRRFGGSAEGREAQLNYVLGTQFPYLFLACRIAHYLKVIERDLLGASRTPLEITRDLDAWLSTFVNSMDAVTPTDRARYPLQDARVSVTREDGDAGWLRAELRIRPQLRYLGSVVTVHLAARLDHRAL